MTKLQFFFIYLNANRSIFILYKGIKFAQLHLTYSDAVPYPERSIPNEEYLPPISVGITIVLNTFFVFFLFFLCLFTSLFFIALVKCDGLHSPCL